jgi:hypothetical protein
VDKHNKAAKKERRRKEHKQKEREEGKMFKVLFETLNDWFQKEKNVFELSSLFQSNSTRLPHIH